MARIVEEVLKIKVSRIVKDGDPALASIITDEIVSGLEMFTQECCDGAVVEIEKVADGE